MNLFFLIYDFLVLPALVFFAHVVSIFNKKVANALRARQNYQTKLVHSGIQKTPRILIHAASMGEFEHIKPLIAKLTSETDISIVVTFFSPSGYEHVKNFPGVDHIFYLPIDRHKTMKDFYNKLNPSLIILSKHDAWPNQVRVANNLKIPVYLVNASLSPQSKRLKWPVKALLTYVYQMIDTIYTISDRDKQVFENYFPNVNVQLIGDTKFDQVLIRKELSKNNSLLQKKCINENNIIICGSVWPEDIMIIGKALKNIIEKNESWKVILVPHDPDNSILNMIFGIFGENRCVKFTEINSQKGEPVLVVDTIGILADLYKYAAVAFVGGGFKQGIHNVMEPAVYGIPVIYGPLIENASEAIKMNQYGGGIVVNDAQEFGNVINEFIKNERSRKKTGKKAFSFTKKNTGATDILINEIKRSLKSLE